MKNKKIGMVYKNGVVVRTKGSEIFVNMQSGYSEDREIVELACSRYWHRVLTPEEKTRFDFSRDFFGKTYTVKFIAFGKEIFKEMCELVVHATSQQTFIWNEETKNRQP